MINKMKILVVRIGRAGDMVMITPALKALTKNYPDAEITILTSPDGRRVLNGFHPQIKNIWVLDRKKLLPFIQRKKIMQDIQQSDFKHIFCFETKASFKKLFNVSKAQQHILQVIEDSQINFAERCLHLVDPALDRNHNPVYLPVQQDAKKKSDDILKSVNVNQDTFIIGMHPSFSGLAKGFGRKGKSFIHKSWPENHWANLAKLFDQYAKQNKIDIKIIIDLLPDDEELGQKIVKASNDSVNLLIPPPNFERYKATLSRMNLLIAPDTGPAHIAAAVDTNLVALFSGHNPDDCAPYTSINKLSVLRAEDCQHPELGLGAISAEDVFQASKKFLPG